MLCNSWAKRVRCVPRLWRDCIALYVQCLWVYCPHTHRLIFWISFQERKSPPFLRWFRLPWAPTRLQLRSRPLRSRRVSPWLYVTPPSSLAIDINIVWISRVWWCLCEFSAAYASLERGAHISMAVIVWQMTLRLGMREEGRQTNSKSSSVSFLGFWSNKELKCVKHVSSMRFWKTHRMVSLSQRWSRSSALASACLHVHVGRALLFSFPCRSQRCHDISRLPPVKKSSALCHTHVLSLVADRWVPGSVNSWLTGPILQSSRGKDSFRQWWPLMKQFFVHGKLLGRDHQEQVQSRGTDVERSQTRHFREQREEQVVLPSVVKRIDQDFEKMLRSAAQMQEWEETYSEYRSRDCGHLQDSRRSLVPTQRPVLREERARRDRHCQSGTHRWSEQSLHESVTCHKTVQTSSSHAVRWQNHRCGTWNASRELAGTSSARAKCWFLWQQSGDLEAHSDADWGSDRTTRRSVSAGVIMRRSRCLKVWTKKQQVVALSSAKSELFAAVKTASERLGIQSVARDRLNLHLDASATMSGQSEACWHAKPLDTGGWSLTGRRIRSRWRQDGFTYREGGNCVSWVDASSVDNRTVQVVVPHVPEGEM